MVYKNFYKKTCVVAVKIAPNEELEKEVHKPITKSFEKWKVHSSFINNIWGANLADMQLFGKFNKGINFYCALLIVLVNMLVQFL